MYHWFDVWEDVAWFLQHNEKAKIVAFPYVGGSYRRWGVFVPLEKNE